MSQVSMKVPWVATLALLLVSCPRAEIHQDKNSPATVKIVKKETRFELLRDDTPYVVKGACGWDHLNELLAAGGNSIRLWGSAKDPAVYDEARKLGLTVCAGLWLRQEQDGFKYSDPEQVKAQFETLLAYVKRYKDHPAILMWGVGNECEGDGKKIEIWKAIEELAKAIKEIDPKHPVITVIAGISKPKIENAKAHCPSLDALGINAYGGLTAVPSLIKRFGWEKAYFVTEFGPRGSWEAPKTSWGAPIENSSTENAVEYLEQYRKVIAAQSGRCLGSYVYFWGVQRWYGMFTAHHRLGAVDAMTEAWTGKAPGDRVPEIASCNVDASGQEVLPGSRHKGKVSMRGGEHQCRIRWEIRGEPVEGGKEPEALPDLIVKADAEEVAFDAPQKAGAYRLHVIVENDKGGAAVANAPFRVTSEK